VRGTRVWLAIGVIAALAFLAGCMELFTESQRSVEAELKGTVIVTLNDVLGVLREVDVPMSAPGGIEAKIDSAIQKIEQAKAFREAGKESEAREKLEGASEQLCSGAIPQIDDLRCSRKSGKCIDNETADELIRQLLTACGMIDDILWPPPVAVGSITPVSGHAPLTISFDASGSYDPDDEIASYLWEFGTGDSAAVVSGTYIYEESGLYTATLTVEDNRGKTDADTFLIEVTEPPFELIVFQEGRPGGGWEILTVKSDGTGVTNLTNHPSNDKYPRFSPDGTQILFASDREGKAKGYVMDVDGSNVTKLADFEICSLFWGADGTILLIAGPEWGFGTVYLVNPDGSNLREVPTPNKVWYAATVSPDASMVTLRAGGGGLNLAYADGSGFQSIAPAKTRGNWSPDGRRFVYHYNREVVIHDTVTGTHEVICTEFDVDGPPVYEDAYWSPDGEYIAFSAKHDMIQSDVWVVRVSDGAVTQCTTNAGNDCAAGWSADSTRVLISSAGVGGPHYFGVYDLATGTYETIYQQEYGTRWYWNYPKWQGVGH